MSDLTLLKREEVYRYLGVKGQPEETVKTLVEQAIEELCAAVRPRFVWRRAALELEEERVRLDSWEIVSRDLSAHLQSCREALLFAATLGIEADRILSKNSVLHPALAVAEQAAAAALIEQYCDDCCRLLGDAERKRKLYLRPRFSPGYGDFSLAYQPHLLALLDAQRRIGLSVTDTQMMTPMKSVTAIIGLTAEKQSCHTGHCADCPNQFCVFRKDE